jgi:hypothetical protein
MTKRSAIELENQREIGELKEAIGQLNTNVAVMAGAINSLKESIDKDSVAHSETRRTLENRVTALETKIDTLELEKAKDTYFKERLKEVEELTKALNERTSVETGSSKRITSLEKATRILFADKDKKDGWTAGAKWAAGSFLVVAVPCIGYVLADIMKKIYG